MAMDIDNRLAIGVLVELCSTADAHNLLHVIGHPERDWSSPVPVARDAPIASLAQPVVEALLAHE